MFFFLLVPRPCEYWLQLVHMSGLLQHIDWWCCTCQHLPAHLEPKLHQEWVLLCLWIHLPQHPSPRYPLDRWQLALFPMVGSYPHKCCHNISSACNDDQIPTGISQQISEWFSTSQTVLAVWLWLWVPAGGCCHLLHLGHRLHLLRVSFSCKMAS